MFKQDLEKAVESKNKFPSSVGSLKKQENSRKKSTSALLTTPKPLTAYHNKVENFSNGTTIPPYLPPKKSVCRSRCNNYNWTLNSRMHPNL